MAEPDKPVAAIDPKHLQQALSEIVAKSAKVIADFVAHPPPVEVGSDPDELGLNQAFRDYGARMLADPAHLAEIQMRAWDDHLKLWNATVSRVLGNKTAPVKEPAKGDNRFRSDLWQSNVVFDYIKQSYLIAADHMQRAVGEVEGLDPQAARKVKFFTRQYIDALAPTNFVATNPEVMKATLDSGGANLLSGFKHLLEDLERGKGKLAIRMTDNEAFRMGENVATTPGKVVFQNDLMQLLQFEPTTPQVDRAPLLIVPPWINKYYILDLRERNSFIRWAVGQGLTVFVISWVNPDERHAGKTFDDYLAEGPLAAMAAIEQATGEASLNVIGYCLGGTLTACLASWLQSNGHAQRIRSLTFFTTMIDFREPGDLGVFVDEQIVDRLEKRMAKRGFLEGSDMAGTFNMLRDNDLIWSFVINNYLLGKDPFPFDLLYWNSDATRMPAKMHTFYLRNMYVRNLLAQPGKLVVGGAAMDLSKVATPACFVSTVEDHIAPWKSTHAGAKLLGGPVKFLLGGSGHIAGIVNPPVAKKYQYWTNDGLAADADTWFATAHRHDGSWWDEWATWIHGFAGGRLDARNPGGGKLRVLEDAPGTYAKFRLDASTQAPPAQGLAKGSAKTPAATETPKPVAPVASPAPVADAPAQAPGSSAVKAVAPATRSRIAKPKATPKPAVAAEPPAKRKTKAVFPPAEQAKVLAPARRASKAAVKPAGERAPIAKPEPAARSMAKPAVKPASKPVAGKVATVAKPDGKARPVVATPRKGARSKAGDTAALTAPNRPGGAAAAISALFRSQSAPADVAPAKAKQASPARKTPKSKDKPDGKRRKK